MRTKKGGSAKKKGKPKSNAPAKPVRDACM